MSSTVFFFWVKRFVTPLRGLQPLNLGLHVVRKAFVKSQFYSLFMRLCKIWENAGMYHRTSYKPITFPLFCI